MHLHASEYVIVWQQEPWVKNYIRTEGGKEETDMQKAQGMTETRDCWGASQEQCGEKNGDWTVLTTGQEDAEENSGQSATLGAIITVAVLSN